MDKILQGKGWPSVYMQHTDTWFSVGFWFSTQAYLIP